MFRYKKKFKHNYFADGGYTLTEVLVVLIIMSFLTSLSGPTLGRVFPQIALTSASDQFDTDLRQAKRDAVRRSVIYSISARAGTSEYVIRATGEADHIKRLPGNVKLGYRVNLRGTNNSQRIIIRILPDGRYEGTSIRLYIKDNEVVIHPNAIGGG